MFRQRIIYLSYDPQIEPVSSILMDLKPDAENTIPSQPLKIIIYFLKSHNVESSPL